MRVGRIRRVFVAVVLLGLSTAACGDQTAAGQRERRHPYAAIEDLPESLGPDGTTIVVGDPSRRPVHLYEDMRCPVCQEFEVTGAGPALLDMTLGKEVRAEYTLASFLDDRLGGTGSKKAANALRAALEQDKFAEYHAVLFRNQPEEQTDGYTDAFLLAMASRVDGLRGPAFDSAVKEMRYADFVAASQKAYEEVGAPGTPAAYSHGKRVPHDVLFTKDLLRLFAGRDPT
ncbi:DsbA family protein [Streptomyces bambusae]|uniref:Thioredoxin domain-containing protein n=1 Tax=Streptomyces bambusae TaxID=1550616 RepID=A0ABS6ZER9_9ACTN|nr:thioredoxin domain-containing protein [Streptomyces bambusae]MBW5486233.1 thioredoxin domain-containing protein [Streptomyces bambusae]